MKKIMLLVITLFYAAAVFAAGVSVASADYNPAPAIPGEPFTLIVRLTNSSSTDAENVVFSLKLKKSDSDTEFPFHLAPDDFPGRKLGRLPSRQTATVQYRVFVDPNALDSAYEIKLESGENDSATNSYPLTIQILGRKPVIRIISATPTTAALGKTTQLQLEIKNTGSSKAINLSVGISEERTVTSAGQIVEREIVPLGAAFAYVPQLGTNDSSTVSFSLLVNPNAEPKAYFVPVNMEFFDENKTKYTDTGLIGIKVTDEPEIGTILSNASYPVPGEKTKIGIDLYNSGTGTAKFLSARIDSDAAAIKQKEFFIGSLEPDDFDSFTADAVIPPETKPGAHTLDITLAYKDKFGEAKTVQKTIPFRVYSREEAQQQNPQKSDSTLSAILLVVIIAAGFLFWRSRKKKQK